ncbi:phosphomannomutase/phosphoglucomutase [Sporichthya sp.]|uniref:phosphomannomutase/phosphoglucomutase n=1 Tax=Sporichthya sp. TaxID=65475 RepID=UPI0017C4DDBF|nr:phosphomannomutase/phosphoglucomutase [Sporichthya sp.]MBA3744051.1 phosphomannomutase/phosphoglucomutase [Sporichthya sp.]
MPARDLSAIVKAYDIRGLVPQQWDASAAHDLGAAFAEVTAQDAPGGVGSPVVIGRDMRETSPELSAAFAAGIASRGRDVVDIGLACTDAVYYASGTWSCPGAMFTASHNPAGYNGIKLCRAGAKPVGQDTGLADVRRYAEAGLTPYTGPVGTIETRDILVDYSAHLRTLVDLTGARPLRVVVDAGNGMGGYVVPTVFAGLPFAIVPLFFELDGTFPNHEPNPIDPKNLRDLSEAVIAHGADIGLAFDGDADRCFFVDETGTAVTPSAIVGLIADRELTREPGATIVYNLITSRAVPELVGARGGRAVRTRVGHSFIKVVMAETGAIFGGEHSGHYYFREFWNADSGMLAALHVLAALSGAPAGSTLSELVRAYERYPSSGEINTVVADVGHALDALRKVWADRDDTVLDDLDGLTVDLPDGRFNVRPSNTEPLLRLNVEATDAARMAELRDEVLAVITLSGSESRLAEES